MQELDHRLEFTKKGWYWKSQYRVHKRGQSFPLWVGPFETKVLAIRVLQMDPKETDPKYNLFFKEG